MKSIFSALLLFAVSCTHAGASDLYSKSNSQVTNEDRPEIARIMQEELPKAFFALATGDVEPMSNLLADDARLRWNVITADDKEGYLKVLVNSFAKDGQRLAIAQENYQFLTENCGLDDPTQEPEGQHKVEVLRNLQGQDFAANRFVVLATFKHHWMKKSDEPYFYADRYIFKKVDGVLKIAEYEFSANLSDLPKFPEKITDCPK